MNHANNLVYSFWYKKVDTIIETPANKFAGSYIYFERRLSLTPVCTKAEWKVSFKKWHTWLFFSLFEFYALLVTWTVWKHLYAAVYWLQTQNNASLERIELILWTSS